MKTLLLSAGRGRKNSLGNAGLENLGLGYIAKVAEFQGPVEVIDLAFEPLNDEEIVDLVREKQIGLVGVSSMTWTTYEALGIAAAIKKAAPEVHLVAGGVGPTSIPHTYVEGFDYVITGEGEDAFLHLLNNLPNTPKGVIPGQRNLHWNGMTYPFRNQKLLESGMLHMRGTCPVAREKQRPTSIVGSRGCPNACTFCMSEAMWERRVTFRDPFEVVFEIEYLVSELGYNCIDFLDLNINLRPEWLLEICELLIKRGLNKKVALSGLWNPAITHRMEEVIAACSEAGFIMFSIGLENSDPAIRDSMGKQKMETRSCHQAFELCLKYGITTRCLVIVGSPGQDEANIEQIIVDLQAVKSSELRCGFHAIFERTRDWDRYNHLRITDDLSLFDTAHQVLQSPLGDVAPVRLQLMRSFYNSPGYRANRAELIRKNPAFAIGYRQLEAGFLTEYGLIEPQNRLQEA